MSVNASSLFDLKAELVKKQEELKRTKSINKNQFVARRPEKKKTIWDKKNKGVTERNEKDAEAVAAENKSLAKSKSALEAKALLYEKLSKGTSALGDDEKELFLVNFQQKSLNHPTCKETEETIMMDDHHQPTDVPSYEEQWVEYVDDLGRSRTCMRKDLPSDAKVELDKNNTMEAHLLSEDMRREQRRLQWEKEEQEAMKNPIRDIHYQNVLHQEVRAHGVGYYAFSKDEEKRNEQMDMLNELSKQTEKQKSSREKLLQKRKAVMAERLAKVRQRKNLKMEEQPSSPVIIESVAESEEMKKLEIEKKMKEIEAEHKRKAHLRPWDKDKSSMVSEEKKPKYSQGEWVEQRRNDRNWEFAPPQAKKTQNFANVPEKLPDDQITNEKLPDDQITSEKQPPKSLYHDFNLDDIPLPDAPSSEIANNAEDIELPKTDDASKQCEKLPIDSLNENVPNYDGADVSNVSATSVEEFQKDLHDVLAHFRNKS